MVAVTKMGVDAHGDEMVRQASAAAAVAAAAALLQLEMLYVGVEHV